MTCHTMLFNACLPSLRVMKSSECIKNACQHIGFSKGDRACHKTYERLGILWHIIKYLISKVLVIPEIIQFQKNLWEVG